MPVGGEEKNPAVFKILDSQGYQVTSSGSIQHSDCVTLFSEEYDRFIENPMDFFMEKVLPRMFKVMRLSVHLFWRRLRLPLMREPYRLDS